MGMREAQPPHAVLQRRHPRLASGSPANPATDQADLAGGGGRPTPRPRQHDGLSTAPAPGGAWHTYWAAIETEAVRLLVSRARMDGRSGHPRRRRAHLAPPSARAGQRTVAGKLIVMTRLPPQHGSGMARENVVITADRVAP